MPFDPSEELFTDADADYRSTTLESTVPPPSLAVLSRTIRNVRGGSRLPNRGDYPPNNHPRSIAPRQMPLAPVRPEIDVKGSSCIVISNSYPSSFAEQQLCSPDWIRMMSDRDDARGRRGDGRLGDPAMVQPIHACKEVLAGLAHLDYSLGVVREYLKPDGELKFVDLCSDRGGFSEYVLWRAGKQSVKSHGWYFADTSAKYPLDMGKMLSECHGAENTTAFQADLLDPAYVD
ncbi:hypothetical protein FBU59_005146, partial [Linderina macrospora]